MIDGVRAHGWEHAEEERRIGGYRLAGQADQEPPRPWVLSDEETRGAAMTDPYELVRRQALVQVLADPASGGGVPSAASSMCPAPASIVE